MPQLILNFYKAFKNSWNGLKNAWHFQWAFKVEVIILIIAMPCAFYLGKTAVERVLLISSVLLLLIMELINSAIETTVNRIGFEYHELSGLAKDLASAAIFLAGFNVLVIWGIFLFYSIR